MAKVYRCPKGCSVSDHYCRCKRCGSWMKYDGDHTIEEIEKKSEEISMEKLPSGVHLPRN
jgi:hypothetical protein